MTARPAALSIAIAGLFTDLADDFDEMPDYSQAACVGADTNLFFSIQKSRITEALALCAACPVRTACLEHALARDEEGVWGGTTDFQRKHLRSRRNNKGPAKKSEVRRELQELVTKPVSVLAEKYHVEERTVNRWRQMALSDPRTLAFIKGL